MPKLLLAIVSAAIALAAYAAPAPAANGAPAPEAAPNAGKEAPAKSARLSLNDATAIVLQAYGGRVLSAAAGERRAEDGTTERGYRVRVDVEGTVKTVFVDRRGRIHER